MANAKLIAYKNKYIAAARLATKETKIFPETVIIASALESNYGNSLLSKNDNNFFGIKGKGRVYSTKENRSGKLVTEKAEFKTYNSPADSFKDYVRLLQTDRYKNAGVLNAATVPAQFAAIKKGGYATDENYIKKLNNLYKNYPASFAIGGTIGTGLILGSIYLAWQIKQR